MVPLHCLLFLLTEFSPTYTHAHTSRTHAPRRGREHYEITPLARTPHTHTHTHTHTQYMYLVDEELPLVPLQGSLLLDPLSPDLTQFPLQVPRLPGVRYEQDGREVSLPWDPHLQGKGNSCDECTHTSLTHTHKTTRVCDQ